MLRTALMFIALAMTYSTGFAQAPPPYTKGDPNLFLTKAREKGRPAVVLFNFHLKSG